MSLLRRTETRLHKLGDVARAVETFIRRRAWRISALESSLRVRRQRRREAAVAHLPRVWMLVGGQRITTHPDVYVKTHHRKLWPAIFITRQRVVPAEPQKPRNYDEDVDSQKPESPSEPAFLIRYFVGKQPLAEAIPDPDGGWRIFYREEP
jgi:hypothetical protein